VLAARFALPLACILGFLIGPAAAQEPPAKQSTAIREVRHRLGLVATRAIANFHSMDSIEESLNDMGMTLHPDVVSLRVRLESALDAAEAAIQRDNSKDANEALDQADGLLSRLAAKLGGG
jgi:hypothetical protein